MENKEKIKSLFEKYLDGRISKEELDALLSFFDSEADKVYISELLRGVFERDCDIVGREELIEQISANTEPKIFAITRRSAKIIAIKKWMSVAAVLLLFVGALSYWLTENDNSQPIQNNVSTDIPAGRNTALLTLASGRKIDLSLEKSGALENQAYTAVDASLGKLKYSQGKYPQEKLAYNVLETPKGGQYRLELSDGTQVWLNAASHLKFPVSFNGADRTVELSGEAYFEVAKNPSKPFKVISGDQVIQVLGTHFNVMAYSDEYYKRTTLLEGSIRLSSHGSQKMVKPGQQATIDRENAISITEADIAANMAWKNGKTYFANADIASIMRSLARWYNLEVEYRGSIPQRRFTGGISRTSNISGMLKILELNDIHVKVEGRKLIVNPNQ